MPKKTVDETIEIAPVAMGTIKCYLVGTSPLIMHRFPRKAWEQLLFPKGRANAAEKADNLKHDPLMEYRESVYRNRDQRQPTAIHLPAGAFTKAIASAALDLPGATKAQILRLVSVKSTQINLYGIPQMYMAMTRSSDIARTPDVRTRAVFPEWACEVEVGFVSTLVKQNQVVNLLAAAGVIVGIGDWRPQKGGAFGRFDVVTPDSTDYQRIVRTQARGAQLDGLEQPGFYDVDTDELYSWFLDEADRREKTVPSTKAPRGKAIVPSPAVIEQVAKTRRNGRATTRQGR